MKRSVGVLSGPGAGAALFCSPAPLVLSLHRVDTRCVQGCASRNSFHPGGRQGFAIPVPSKPPTLRAEARPGGCSGLFPAQGDSAPREGWSPASDPSSGGRGARRLRAGSERSSRAASHPARVTSRITGSGSLQTSRTRSLASGEVWVPQVCSP